MQSIEQAQQELIDAYQNEDGLDRILFKLGAWVQAVQGYESQLDALMLELTDEDKQYIKHIGTPIQFEQYPMQFRITDDFFTKWEHLQAMDIVIASPIESRYCSVSATDIGKALARRIQAEQIRKRKPDYD